MYYCVIVAFCQQCIKRTCYAMLEGINDTWLWWRS